MEVNVSNSLGGAASSSVQYGSDAALAKVLLFRGYPDPLLHFASACCVLFMLIGIPGNITTIAALAKCKKLQNATAVFLINLHISDLIMCSLIMPMTAMTFAQKHWTHGWIMCRLYPYFKYVLQATSIFTIQAISINRYVIVCHPLWYSRLYNRRNISIMLLILWTSTFTIFSVPLFEVWGRLDLNLNIGFCMIVRDKYDRTPEKFLISLGVLGPLVTIVLCYARIWWVVRKTAKKSQGLHDRPTPPTHAPLSTSDSLTIKNTNEDCNTPSIIYNEVTPNEEKNIEKIFKTTLRLTRREGRQKGPSKRDKKLNTMITAVMVSFFITYLPSLAAKLLHKKFGPIAHVFSHLLVYSGTCMHPIIYVLISYEYRQAYKSLYQDIMKQFEKQ